MPPRGRPPVQHIKHVHKIELPEGFLSRQDADITPRWRIAGAAATAVGTYLLVDLVGALGRTIRDAAAPVPLPLAILSPGVFLLNFFTRQITGQEQAKFEFPEGFKPNWLGIALGTTVGGMVLAGLNPGLILSGIGDIIDGLIPG